MLLVSLAVVLSERMMDRVKMCEIRQVTVHYGSPPIFNLHHILRSEIYGASDHCPLVMEISGPL